MKEKDCYLTQKTAKIEMLATENKNITSGENFNSMCDVALSMWLLFLLFSPFSMQNEDRARPSENSENAKAWGFRKTLSQVLTLFFFEFSIMLP